MQSSLIARSRWRSWASQGLARFEFCACVRLRVRVRVRVRVRASPLLSLWQCS